MAAEKSPDRVRSRLLRLRRTVTQLIEEGDERGGASWSDGGLGDRGTTLVEEQGDAGIYVAVFCLDRSSDIAVGRLGRFRFDAGLYLYVGSAQRGLAARLQRHGRHGKPCRWHMDYLSNRATMVGTLTVAGTKARECRVARALAGEYRQPVGRFGSSDCRCRSHLFYAAAV